MSTQVMSSKSLMQSLMFVLVVAGFPCAAYSNAALTIFTSAEYPLAVHHSLADTINSTLSTIQTSDELCLAFSSKSAEVALQEASTGISRCALGVVMLSAAPAPSLMQAVQVPLLVVHGVLDGVVRFSEFAAVRHRSTGQSSKHRVHFASILGASHHSFIASTPQTIQTMARLDLVPEITQAEALSSVADIVRDFLGATPPTGALAAAEAHAARLSAPVIAALKLEGSSALGQQSCNSDFPTNPSCHYTKWPDHSLPFGPAAAPSPPLPSDCICGSPWVMQNVGNIMANFAASKNPSATVVTNDAFQDVSDTHPFHLPHIFNTCAEGDGTSMCVLNSTTLTMPIVKAGDLFPNASSAPLSALELRTKAKSRQAIWQAAGLGGDSSLDKNTTVCKQINQLAYDWAMENAESSVRERFATYGEPFVMVDDKEATIGITGPEWIKDELVFSRVNSKGSSHIEVQSWSFVVGDINGGDVPWFFPVGMHYCKLLSPARAMEWIYTDGLRARRSLTSF